MVVDCKAKLRTELSSDLLPGIEVATVSTIELEITEVDNG